MRPPPNDTFASSWRRPVPRSPLPRSRAFHSSQQSPKPHKPQQRWGPRLQGLRLVPSLQTAGAILLTAASVFAAVRVVYQRFSSRASASSRGGIGMQDGSVQFSVATFNLRGVMDRWAERRPLAEDLIRRMDADVVCFQEVLTGEFEQERQLLGPSYTVFPCKAALFNLLSSGGLARWYAMSVSGWLKVQPLQQLLVSLPPAVESWREKLRLTHDLFRTIRDLTMAPFFGNSVACRLGAAHEINHSTLVLGDWRAAQRIEFSLENGLSGSGSDEEGGGGGNSSSGGGSRSSGINPGMRGGGSGAAGGPTGVQGGGETFKFWVVNTHLDHYHTNNRQRQALEVCRWMDKVKEGCAAIVFCGDLNGGPHELFHQVLEEQGYVSAYRACHGQDPQGTWPTGIQAPLMDHGNFECLDYIYVWVAEGYSVEVVSADLCGMDPAPHDKTLFPSDHAALRVDLRIKRKPPKEALAAAAATVRSGADPKACAKL